jgi:hypothetical protein
VGLSGGVFGLAFNASSSDPSKTFPTFIASAAWPKPGSF